MKCDKRVDDLNTSEIVLLNTWARLRVTSKDIPNHGMVRWGCYHIRAVHHTSHSAWPMAVSIGLVRRAAKIEQIYSYPEHNTIHRVYRAR